MNSNQRLFSRQQNSCKLIDLRKKCSQCTVFYVHTRYINSISSWRKPASKSFGVFSAIKLKLDKGSLALPSVGDLLKGFPIEHYTTWYMKTGDLEFRWRFLSSKKKTGNLRQNPPQHFIQLRSYVTTIFRKKNVVFSMLDKTSTSRMEWISTSWTCNWARVKKVDPEKSLAKHVAASRSPNINVYIKTKL